MTARQTGASEKLSYIYDKSRDAIDAAAGEAQVLYEKVRPWLPDRTGAVVLSSAVGAGLLGYLAGRRSRARAARRTQPTVAAALAPVSELDIAPFFKFLKLWMLYRVATKD